MTATRPDTAGTTRRLSIAGLATYAAALGFARINDFISPTEGGGDVDGEEGVIIVVMAVVTAALFAGLGRWVLRSPVDSARPAKTALICSCLGIVGIVAFWMSVPILLGGLGATLALEARRRSPYAGREGLATAALVLGAVAVAAGAVLWLIA